MRRTWLDRAIDDAASLCARATLVIATVAAIMIVFR